MNGSMAQHESFCVRSTLHHSLLTQFYQLPELSAIYYPDILIFRSSDAFGSKILSREEWRYIDVISCAAFKSPEAKIDAEGKKVYAEERHKKTMLAKVRLIFQVAKLKSVTHVVLGTFGYLAYGNPIKEVAEIFRRVLVGDRRRMNSGSGIEEVVFAVFDEGK